MNKVTNVKLIDQDTFQARKKLRLEEARNRPVRTCKACCSFPYLFNNLYFYLAIPPPKPLASAPTCHEIAGYMPGRLEFETEWENDAEGLIRDMEFGFVHRYGGDDQPTREDVMAMTTEAKDRMQEDISNRDNRQPQAAAPSTRGLGVSMGGAEGQSSGVSGGPSKDSGVPAQNQSAEKGKEGGKDEEKDDAFIAIWDEEDDDLELKLTMHEIYNERIDRRLDAKQTIFERGLLDYKKVRSCGTEANEQILLIRTLLSILSGTPTDACHGQKTW